ncbi:MULTISPECIES: TraR/DksA C4-type zinc finger protein [unclassified Pseudodesulfovibrio]|uniref:TraR/DksA family transcriptional regulator n=1 Tax=unclassified Pseudodesulfovibrio TaxID=2661612 RepID=UPI000FEBAE52|nr:MULTISPECIES: TraR/DksA C4-type zinc finger protein [unclassified Pseudodesulfovibrio]MCJ2166154.1 TraR/DksA C4-type zinc finger protein [Pseudodesulfovibrio sp. S3-i]RWU02387.1 TraR/DksA family transcriptional regulator [Pseudodesulfovibrio sp. S3]
MTESQKREFKVYAREEIAALKAEIPRLKELVKPVAPDNAIGRISRMDNIVNQSVSEAQLSKSKVRLVRLQDALKRVDEDEDFGLCIDCGDPIPMARLQAMPETQFCVQCAE